MSEVMSDSDLPSNKPGDGVRVWGGCVWGGAVLDCQEGSTAKGPFKLNDTLNVFRYKREDKKMP